MSEEITTLTKDEFYDMMKFLEKSYRHHRGLFPTRYPHVWSKDTIQYENRIILKKDGKIVSHVGIFPLTMIVDDARIKMGGIGGVATLQEYRGKGYMIKLMNYSIEKMKRDGYPISILWGDRQRYGHFGYETVGKLAVFSISLRSLKAESKPKEVEFEVYDNDLNKVIENHEKEPIRIERSKRDYSLLFDIPYLMTFLGNESYISYMHYDPRVIIEYGGEPNKLISLIYSFLKAFNIEFGISSIEVQAPYYSYDTFYKLRSVCSDWSIRPEAMVKILSLSKLFKEYKPLLEEKELKLEFSLENRDSGEAVRVTIERESVEVEENRKSNLHLALNERDLVKLIFDGVEEVGLSGKYSILSSVFPLPLHVWELDHI